MKLMWNNAFRLLQLLCWCKSVSQLRQYYHKLPRSFLANEGYFSHCSLGNYLIHVAVMVHCKLTVTNITIQNPKSSY